MEIILGEARRRWSEDDKRALVAATFVDGETVNGVARRHNVSPSMLFSWRRQYREALTSMAPASVSIGFAPVAIALPEPDRSPPPLAAQASMPLIELEFGGGVHLRISGAVDPDLAAAVVKAMQRR
jgi:transposase